MMEWKDWRGRERPDQSRLCSYKYEVELSLSVSPPRPLLLMLTIHSLYSKSQLLLPDSQRRTAPRRWRSDEGERSGEKCSHGACVGSGLWRWDQWKLEHRFSHRDLTEKLCYFLGSLKNSLRKWFFKEPWFERFFVEPYMAPYIKKCWRFFETPL